MAGNMADVGPEFQNWVKDLEEENAAPTGKAADSDEEGGGAARWASAAPGGGGKAGKKTTAAAAELEQEMKLLQWHKLANEAALKAALIRTKRLKESEGGGAASPK